MTERGATVSIQPASSRTFLGRRPDEPVDADLQAFYQTLLDADFLEGLRAGSWQLCGRTGWPDKCMNTAETRCTTRDCTWTFPPGDSIF